MIDFFLFMIVIHVQNYVFKNKKVIYKAVRLNLFEVI